MRWKLKLGVCESCGAEMELNSSRHKYCTICSKKRNNAQINAKNTERKKYGNDMMMSFMAGNAVPQAVYEIISDPDDSWIENSVLENREFYFCLRMCVFTPGTIVKHCDKKYTVYGKPSDVPGSIPAMSQKLVQLQGG